MIIQGFSENVIPVKIFRGIIEDPNKKVHVHVGADERLHRFYYKAEEERLFYETEDDEGNIRKVFYIPVFLPSNLPGVKADVLYLKCVGLKAYGKLFTKLYLKAFTTGTFFCSRHHYRHIYECQEDWLGNREVRRMHRYNRRIDALIDSKKKWRWKYGGKTTRTAERLEAYQQKSDEAGYQSLLQLQVWIDRHK